ncbi:MAG: DUF4149 domain-containing protein [Campylobacter sp.]|nr:DUF4149 domain-containing protein [Campylobacter sp.]
MRKILPIYLFLIAIVVGIELTLGVLVAPTIFYPSEFLGDNVLSHFQSGQLMTNIFVKYNTPLIIISIIILIYEMINFNNNKSQSFNMRFSTLMIGLIHICLALTFVLYFSDYIVGAQAKGPEATMTAEFYSIHNASEWTMKLLLILQTLLFFLKFPRQKNAN